MSDDNVLPFSGHKRPTPDETAIEQRRAQEGRDRADRKRRLSETLRHNPPLRPTDRISVAQALNDLLVRTKQKYGLSSAKILGKAGYADKHKRDYASPRESLSQDEFARRLSLLRNGEGPYKRIPKHTDPFNKIVKAVAELTGDDLGELQFEVFGQVNFRSTPTQEPDDGFEELASRLRFIAESISARYDLSKFFQELEKAGVAPAPVDKVLKFTSDNKDTDGVPAKWFLGWPIELGQFTWVCDSEQRGDLPAYPMVILGAWTLDSPFPVLVPTERKTAQGWPAVVLSFCIAPVGKDRSATPALRVDICARIEFGWEATFDIKFGWASLWVGKASVNNYEIDIKQVPKLPAPFRTGDIERWASENHWQRPDILFLPIDGTVCGNWFQFQPGVSLYFRYDRPIPHPDLGPSLCENFGLDAPFSPFGADTLAGLLDAALWTGGLDRLLEEQAKQLTEAFEAARKAAAELRERGWETVKKRLENHENP